jgi:zinc protease
MDGITLDEINVLASKWITDENMIVIVTMPEKKGLKVPVESDILKVIDKVKKAKTSPWVDNTKTEPFFAQEPKAGKVEKTVKNEKFGFTEYTLSNGATVIIKSTDFKNDEIRLSAQSAGGSSLYEDNEMMNVNFAASIIDACGIGTYNNSQLQKFMQGKNFGLQPSIKEEQEAITGSCAPKDLEYQLQYLYMYFTAPRSEQEILDNQIEKLKTQINQVKNSPEVSFQLDWLKALYPNDKRTIMIPTEAQLKQLNLAKMLKIWKERFNNAADWTFTFVGNIDEKTALPLIEKYIGGLPADKGKKEQWKDRSTEFAKGLVDKTTYKGEANKGMVTVSFENNFDWTDKDRYGAKLLSNIISIKLTQTIREQLGGTYSPYFKMEYSKYPKSKIVTMCLYTCDPENIDKLTTATFEVYDKIINEGPTDEDIVKAKEQLITGRKTDMESNNYWASIINGSRWYGYDMLTLDEYTNTINAITKEDLKALAAKYLKHDSYVRASLKPETMKPTK